MDEKPSNSFVGLKCPPELLREVDKLARRKFISRSDAIRSMLRQQLEREREQRAGGDQEAAA
jgi:metal-responsive CopG/Arc/MetJ family transcriptional regulator